MKEQLPLSALDRLQDDVKNAPASPVFGSAQQLHSVHALVNEATKQEMDWVFGLSHVPLKHVLNGGKSADQKLSIDSFVPLSYVPRQWGIQEFGKVHPFWKRMSGNEEFSPEE
ncbi:hypothetical protein EXS65_00950 [Candidatus Peribacteria bacterium]|nr:hypothetical protein [Candidatus Peribacteria bacterium]